MACEKASFSCLLNKGDTTTIAVLLGVGLGGFILGLLLPLSFRLLRRSTSKSRAGSWEIGAQADPKTQRSSDDAYDEAPFSPIPRPHTFVRHNLKPPMSVFSSDGNVEWKSLRRPHTVPREPQHPGDPFARIQMGQESSTTLSGVIDHHGHLGSSDNLLIPKSPVKCTAFGLRDTTFQQEHAIVRRGVSQSWSESTIRDTGLIIDPSAAVPGFIEEKNVMAASTSGSSYVSRRSTRNDPNRIHKARSDPRIAHSGREKTRYDIWTYEHRRIRTLSSPQQSSAPAMEMAEHQGVRERQLTIEHPSEHIDNPVGSSLPNTASKMEPESELTRQTSQRQAATFYQEHAKRHLSLPYGGPLNSIVLPDSPSGVIGNTDEGAKRDFSLA